MLNIKQSGLNKAFKKTEIYSKNLDEKEDKEANSVEETIRIANFAEELKDKANFNGMDICFVIDTTGSMGPYIEGAKESLRTIIEDAKKSLEELNAKEESLKFAVVGYRDHPPQDKSYVTKICDFCSSTDAETFINKEISPFGGGDIPEAVMDGLHDALNTVSWREDSEKFLFLVLDAPPHGKQFGSTSDGFPEGCPCGHSELTLLPQLRDMKIDFTIIKINNSIDEMIKIFSQFINIDVFQPKIFKSSRKMSGTAYTEGVKGAIKSCMNKKIISNIIEYKK